MNLKDSAKEYFGLKRDAVKLSMVENLSVILNQFLSTFVLLIVFLVAIVFLAAAGNRWLGDILDNQAAASLITGGLFLVLFLVLFLLRKKLFINNFVRTFSQVFFKDEDNELMED